MFYQSRTVENWLVNKTVSNFANLKTQMKIQSTVKPV